jgi:hypothetical protein
MGTEENEEVSTNPYLSSNPRPRPSNVQFPERGRSRTCLPWGGWERGGPSVKVPIVPESYTDDQNRNTLSAFAHTACILQRLLTESR